MQYMIVESSNKHLPYAVVDGDGNPRGMHASREAAERRVERLTNGNPHARAYTLAAIAAGNVTVNVFDGRVEATALDETLHRHLNVTGDVVKLVEEGLVAKPRYSHMGMIAKLTKAGRAAVAEKV